MGEMTKEVSSEAEALELGIQVERDTIAYYDVLLSRARSETRKEALNRILAEERKHLVKLQEELRKRDGAEGGQKDSNASG